MVMQSLPSPGIHLNTKGNLLYTPGKNLHAAGSSNSVLSLRNSQGPAAVPTLHILHSAHQWALRRLLFLKAISTQQDLKGIAISPPTHKVTSKEIQTASLESCRKISKYLQIPTVRRRLIKSVRPTHTAMRPHMCGNISKNAADGTERSIFTTTNKIYCQNIFLNCSSSFQHSPFSINSLTGYKIFLPLVLHSSTSPLCDVKSLDPLHQGLDITGGHRTPI